MNGGWRPVDFLSAIGICLLWGINIIAAKFTVEATGPFTAAALRMILILLVCAPWLRPVAGRNGKLALFGLLNGALFLLLMNAALAISTNVGALAIAGQMSIPFSIILGVLLLRERLTQKRLVGTLLAFLGVVVIVFDPQLLTEIPGLIVMLAATLVWAFGTILQRTLAGISVLNIFGWNGLMGTVVLLPASIVMEPRAIEASPHMTLAVAGWFIFTAVGSGVVGQCGMARLLHRHPINMILPLLLLVPVISVITAWLVFDSPVTPLMLLGGALALIGVAVVNASNQSVTPTTGGSPPSTTAQIKN